MRILFAILIMLATTPETFASPSLSNETVLRATYNYASGTVYKYLTKDGEGFLRDLYAFDDLDRLPKTCVDNVCTPSEITPNPNLVCFTGDRNQVCSLLSKLSERDLSDYIDGLHERSRLDQCALMGRGDKPVIARFELIHDYENYAIKFSTEIERCVD